MIVENINLYNDLYKFTDIKELEIQYLNIDNLIIPNTLSKLTSIIIKNVNFKYLFIPENINLKKLFIVSHTKFIPYIDIKTKNIEKLSIINIDSRNLYFNPTIIKSIILTNCNLSNFNLDKDVAINVNILKLDYNNIKEIDLTYYTNLTFLSVEGNSLNKCLIPNSNKLNYINLSMNNLTEISFPYLYGDYDYIDKKYEPIEIILRNNQLKNINIETEEELILNISYNEIENIDLTNVSKLKILRAQTNKIKTIKFNDNNEYLEYINLKYNLIEEFILNKNEYTEEINLENNPLKYVYIEHGYGIFDINEVDYVNYSDITFSQFCKEEFDENIYKGRYFSLLQDQKRVLCRKCGKMVNKKYNHYMRKIDDRKIYGFTCC